MLKNLTILFFCSCILLTGCSFKPNENGRDIFRFVRKNVGKSISLQCSYTNEKGKEQIAYIKDSATRIDDFEIQSGNWSLLLKDNLLWLWKAEENKGLFFELNKEVEDKSSISTKEVIEKIEYQKQNCQPAILSDEIFELPANIEFTEE